MTLPSVTAQAYSHVNASISNITISGYKAIGVVGFNLANYFCSLVTCKLQGTGVGMTIYNSNSSSASMTPTVTILYAKTF